ncbi:hypothetical protein AMTRI_Chr06g191900 [Amborella trichopoda]
MLTVASRINPPLSLAPTEIPHPILPCKSHEPQSPFLSLLQNCENLNQLKQIHAHIIKNPPPNTRILLNKLIQTSCSLTHIDFARKVFDQIPEPTVFLYNTMIRAYASNNSRKEGILLYLELLHKGPNPDDFTFPFLLKACESLSLGKQIHGQILKTSVSSSDVYSQTSLVTFYLGIGELELARKVFNKMPERNVVSWTAMTTGYVQAKRFDEALGLFHEMQVGEVEPNGVTLVNVLCACAHLGAVEMGKWVHGYIDRNMNRIDFNAALGTALLDMYVKCGYIKKALRVFEDMDDKRSAFMWNAMIGGLAIHGLGEKALELFSLMLASDLKPDDITFIGLLCACTHSGLVDKGKEYFYAMEIDYGIVPSIKHYGCLVDLLGRSGHLNEAYKTVKKMPMKPNGAVWGALLNACHAHSNVELAEIVMEHLIELEPLNDGNYVLMSNIYAASCRWDDVAKVRRFMKDRGIEKTPGCSSIEVNNVVHEFMVGDALHPQSKEIYSVLEDVAARLREEGYIPRTSFVLQNIDEEERESALCHHSEKLAIAFGLISTSPGSTIRVVKNLRACGDCHEATKLISKIYDREIIVRDRNRFHHFKDGACSCRDFW